MSWVHLAGSIPCLNILLIIFIAHLQVVTSHKPLKALFYSPTYGHSHLRFIGALAETFADAGHTAHLLIPEWYPSLKENGTTAIKRIIRIEPSFPSQYPKIEFFKKPFMKEEDMRGWHFFENTSVQFCKDLLSNEKLLNELRDEHYDIGYAELIEYCPFGIFRLIKVKSMAIVSALPLIDTIVEAWGIPSPPSYVTDSLQSHVNAPFLSYWQRFLSLVTTFTKRRLFRHLLDAEDKLYKEMIGNEFPNLRDIIQNASVAFINTPPLVEIPRPLSPKIINIGGLVSRLSRKKVLKSGVNMTLPKSDTVLFSLGSITNTSAMPSIMIEAMKEMVTRFPKIHFILKMTTADSEKHFANFPNVQIFEWIDQIALLGVFYCLS
ncbi:hypothetical protein AB6A40_009931 [Gnathostoma spinigerum]|uniref:glucuronosyltransferase n=1 Tax=Gnathostoma spinigerum TaxID=75299 RepID=A0ABD6F1I8_9BILA